MKPVFDKHKEIFKTTITANSDSLTALYEDCISFCPIFTWTNNPPTTLSEAPTLHCLLLNLISKDIIYPYRAASLNKASIKKSSLRYLQNFMACTEVPNGKNGNRNTKSRRQRSRLTYRKRKRHHEDHFSGPSNESARVSDSHGYINPFNDSRRALDNSILWIYLTSSNFRHGCHH
ncbi:hypothetical protein RirG_096340 [Rhizophagus irregularis DAOM 197198w]|uniref:Uncharacterized protein n=1 Tax=Rhizophagus irregularis (strain DAOM 197198w) TaxID=1432141 RepID=A0A015MRM5_RHIIW|nr:hypothetical protein RirG_096340 [Rhizophagus irregularis DAOM 197198w]